MMTKLTALVIFLTLTGCAAGSALGKKETVVVRGPERVVTVSRAYYVPIHADLTKRCAWADGVLPSQALTEMVIRAGCLRQYERQFGVIEAIQGEPKP